MSSIELWVTSWVLDVSIKATLLALAAWAGIAACRVHSSDVKHRVWLFVLGGMLLLPALVNLVPGVSLPTWLYPPLQAAAVSGETGGGTPLVSPQQPPVVERSVPAPSEPMPALPLGELEPATRARDAVSHDMAEQEPQEAIASPQPAPSASEVPSAAMQAAGSRDFALAAIGVYLAGVGLLMVRLLVGTLQASRLVRRASQVDLACSAAGLPSRTRIVESAELRVPVTLGHWRPVVVLPADWSTWSEPSLAMVLAHEGEHVRRRDTWVTLLAAFNVAIYWFHPVAWILRRRLLDLAEQACDDAVIQVTGSRNEYAQSLLDMASRLTATSGRLRPFGVAMARKASVVKRIEAIIDNDRPLSRKIGAVGALLLLCLMAPLVFLAAGLRATAPTVAAEAVAPAEKDDAAAKEEPRPAEKLTAPAEKNAKPAETADSTPQGNSLRVRVVDEAGKPLTVTKLKAKCLGHEADYVADAEGRATVAVPSPNGKFFSLIASPDGYPPVRKWWRNEAGNDLIPAEFTFVYQQGHTIGGVVHDEQGKPISGVKVSLSVSSQQYEQTNMCLALWDSVFLTDSEGRWHLDHIPQKIEWISVGLEHPDYIVDLGHIRSDAEKRRIEDRTAVMVMKKGIPVSGTVTDADGKPIANTTVILGEWYSPKRPSVSTDQKGRYRFASLAPGDTILTVVCPGLAPELRSVDVRPSMKPVDFQLEKGHTLRVRVVGKDGKPIGGVFVTPDTWRGKRVLCDLGIRGRTDAEGRWAWTWAPRDAVETDFGLTGRENYMSIRRLPLTPQEAEHVVTLSRALTISGQVIDAETKRPIPSFRVVHGYMSTGSIEQIGWDYREAREGKNGQYELTISQPSRTHLVRIEADGCEPGISREFKNDEGSVVCDFALRKSRNLSVIVRLPDGKPAAGAEAYLCPEQPGKFINTALFVKSGRFSYPDHSRPHLTAGPDGRLSITPQENDFLLVVLHDQGYAQTTSQKLTANPQITLTAWARLEGVVRSGTKPVPGLELFAHENNPHDPKWGFLNHDDRAETDAQGRFVFPKLKPGRWRITGAYGVKDYARVELAPGQTFMMNIDRTGRPLVGQIQWPGRKPQSEKPRSSDRDVPSQRSSRDGQASEAADSSSRKALTGDKDAEIVIVGRVRNEAGSGIGGAKLWLPLKYDDPNRLAEATTTNSGEFTLRVPAAWTEPGAFIPPSTIWCYAQDHQIAAAHAYQHLKRRSHAPIEIVLKPKADTGFVVKSLSGAPIAGARVEPMHFRTVGNIFRQLRELIAEETDKEGRVFFPEMGREGFGSVEVTAEGYGVQQLRLGDLATEAAIRTITLRPTGRLEGRLVCDDKTAIKSARVHVYQDDFLGEHTSGTASAEVHEDGRFVVPAFAEGAIELMISVDRSLTLRPRIPEHLEILAGKTTRVDVPFERTVRVRGRVQTKGDGAPVAGAAVSVDYGAFRQGDMVLTGADGRFETNVLAGVVRRQVIMRPEKYSRWIVEEVEWDTVINVPAGVENIDLPPLTLVETSERTGRLIDRSNRPVAGALRVVAIIGTRVCDGCETDENGAFTLRLPKSFKIEKYHVIRSWGTAPIIANVLQESPLVLQVRD